METFYTDERNTQMLIALMKAHGIKKVVASPGTTNMCFVASIQQDSYFEIYSSVDERSAAYIACGIAAESGEAVALSCTGATASRNYIPGLTEAFYRKLPILAITSMQHIGKIGQNVPQVIDRTVPLNDIVKLSVQIPNIHDAEDEWAYGVMLNNALLELKRHGGGPVHINLTTTYSGNFYEKGLPNVQVIQRIYSNMNCKWPQISCNKIGIFVGAHKKWSKELTQLVDDFCEAYNGVVFCDHTSNYQGKYKVLASLITGQKLCDSPCSSMDICIHIGDVSGAYLDIKPAQVWRVNPDGEIRDTFKKLHYVFEMEEIDFFKYYVEKESVAKKELSYYEDSKAEYNRLLGLIPELPFSNIWIAKNTISRLPKGSVLHFGILNSLRSWNFFEMSSDILGYSNTGGFGIDGGVSTLIGASLVNSKKLYFGVVGDLAFFYDMNAIGNRHVGNNIRLMVVNNGRGTEFRNYGHHASKFGDEADTYIAAAGHYGNQSMKLIKHYAEDLGFEYLSATDKEEYLKNVERFISPEITEKPMLFEVFTSSEDESNALQTVWELSVGTKGIVKKEIKKVLGEKNIYAIKKFIK